MDMMIKMSRENKISRKGFTLIELLVVVAIIALLLSIIMPSLKRAREVARMMLCANNQHHAQSGIFAYAADNDNIYPPHPAERTDGSFSVLNYLNYHQGASHNPGEPKNEGTYYYLGGYLPQVDVFICPLGRTKDYREMQRQYADYRNYSGEGTLTSYNLFWGGYKLTATDGTPVPDRIFEGPRGKGGSINAANLLISDSIFDFPGINDDWWLAHKPARGTGQFQDYIYDPVYGNYCAVFWIYTPLASSFPADGSLPPEMAEMKWNAGYTDGRVVKYSGSEVVWTTEPPPPTGMHYIPEKWR